MGAVAEIQSQLQAHSEVLARLGRERAELHSRRCRMICRGANINRGSSRSPSPGMPTRRLQPSLEDKVSEKEQEVRQLRDRVTEARERYLALVAEAGGQEVVQEAGLAVPSSRALAGCLMPRRSPSPVTAGSVLPSPVDSGSSYPSRSTPQLSSATNTIESTRRGAGSGNNSVMSKMMKAKVDSRAAQVYRINEQPAHERSPRHVNDVAKFASVGDDTASCAEIGALGTGGYEPSPRGEVMPGFNLEGVRLEDSAALADGGNYSRVGQNFGANVESAISPFDMAIRLGPTVSPAAVRLQSDEALESREADFRSPLSYGGMVSGAIATSDGIVECTPSPARSHQSGFEPPGSAVLVKQRRADPSSAGQTLEFDEAKSNASSSLSKFRRGEQSVGFDSVNGNILEAELADRPVSMSMTPSSQQTQTPSATPMVRVPESIEHSDVDGMVRISSRPTAMTFAETAIAAEVIDHVDTAETSMISAHSSANNGPHLATTGSHTSSRTSLRNFPATLRTTASLGSLHSGSSSRGASLKPGVTTTVITSRPHSPSRERAGSLHVPVGGRMVWSAVMQSPVTSPRNPSPPRRTMSPGMPGPPRRSHSPLHAGPVKPWSAIAGEAMSPAGSLSPSPSTRGFGTVEIPRFDITSATGIGTLSGTLTRSTKSVGALSGTLTRTELPGTLTRGTSFTLQSPPQSTRVTEVYTLHSPPRSRVQSRSPPHSRVQSRGPSPAPSPPLSLTMPIPLSSSAKALPKSPIIPVVAAPVSHTASVPTLRPSSPVGIPTTASQFPHLATTLQMQMPLIVPRADSFASQIAAPPPTVKTGIPQWLPSDLVKLPLQADPRRGLSVVATPLATPLATPRMIL